MRKFAISAIFSLCLLGTIPMAHAQNIPSGISYQAVVRNSTSELLTNTNVGVRILIRQGSASGSIVYAETHETKTNVNGLLSFVIGEGNATQGSFEAIDWSNGPFFVQTDTDPNGGSNYSISSTTQLLSVPFAYYAAKSGNAFSGSYNDLSDVPSDLVKTSDLAQIATSGSYSDLQDAPQNVSDFINDAGFLNPKTLELVYDPKLGLGVKEGTNFVNIPLPQNVSELKNDAGFLNKDAVKQNLTMTLEQGEKAGEYVLQLSDGNEKFGDAQTFKVPVKVSELENDSNYLKRVDLSLKYENSELTLINATNKTQSKVSLPSKLSEFDNDRNFMDQNKLKFNITDGKKLQLIYDEVAVVAEIDLPDSEGSLLPPGNSPGDILYWNSKEWAVLPSGLEGQVLTYSSSGLTWSNPTVFNEKDLYKDGDIFVNSRGEVEGVILQSDPSSSTALLVGLKDYSNYWSMEKEYVGAKDSNDGWNNMVAVKQMANWENKYPAFAQIDNMNGNKWYIPSTEELKMMFQNREKLNAQLQEAGGSPIDSLLYMSSTEAMSSLFLGITTDSLKIYDFDSKIKGDESKLETSIIDGDTITFFNLFPGDDIYVEKDTTMVFRPVRKLSWTELNSKNRVSYNVGDVYYEKGNPIPVGVVFYVSEDGKSGKIVSLTEKEDQKWFTGVDPKYIGLTNDFGSANMTKLLEVTDNNLTDYPSFAYCADNPTWVLPSTYELSLLFSQYSVVSATLSKLNKENGNVKLLQLDKEYLSSSEKENEDNVILLGSGSLVNGKCEYKEVEKSKKTGALMRTIKDFNL